MLQSLRFAPGLFDALQLPSETTSPLHTDIPHIPRPILLPGRPVLPSIPSSALPLKLVKAFDTVALPPPSPLPPDPYRPQHKIAISALPHISHADVTHLFSV